MINLKPILLFFAGMFLIISCKEEQSAYMFSCFKGNGSDGLHLAYSIDGYNFIALKSDSSFLVPEVSKDKLMRDPCVITDNDGKFHMVWTVSWNAKGIGYAYSTDLINWSKQKYIPVMEHEPKARNCWAPEIIYDENEDIYMIYWATTIPGRFPETDSTSESGYNHRMYYTTTKDFINFSETKLLYDPGFSVIDAVIKKYNNKYFMILKDETRYPEPQKNLHIAKSNYLTHGYSKPGSSITMAGVWVEGPSLMKIDANYVIYFDMYRNQRMGAIQSNNLKNWVNISDTVSFPKGTKHGTIFKVPESVLENLKLL